MSRSPQSDQKIRADFFSSYREIIREEDQFIPPIDDIKGDFYRYVLPYDVFLSRLMASSSFDKARSSLAQCSSDRKCAKDLLLIAFNNFGIAETATLLRVNDILVSHGELEEFALRGKKKSDFFEWSTHTRHYRR